MKRLLIGLLLALPLAAATMEKGPAPKTLKCSLDDEEMSQASAVCYDTYCGVFYSHTNKNGAFHTEYHEYKK